MKTKSSACGTLAPSAVASATSSYRASVHPPEGFYLIGNGSNFLSNKKAENLYLKGSQRFVQCGQQDLNLHRM